MSWQGDRLHRLVGCSSLPGSCTGKVSFTELSRAGLLRAWLNCPPPAQLKALTRKYNVLCRVSSQWGRHAYQLRASGLGPALPT